MIETDRTLFTRRTLIVAIALVLAFAAFMYLLDRPAWCDQGFGLWTGAATGCTSQHLLDPYTLSHILHGVIFYWMLRPFAEQIFTGKADDWWADCGDWLGSAREFALGH